MLRLLGKSPCKFEKIKESNNIGQLLNQQKLMVLKTPLSRQLNICNRLSVSRENRDEAEFVSLI
jgi:hypothetical protein